MKVTVIGASLSGLFVAYYLSKGGMEVEVYERSCQLGDPPRTLIVTSKLIDILDFVPEEAIINRVKRFEIFSKSRVVSLELSVPDLVIEREKLINLLAQRAKESGAKIFEGYQFEGFIRVGKKIVATLRNWKTGECRLIVSDILVGADGISSEVARTISSDGYFSTNIFQAKVIIPGKETCDTCQIWFDKNYTNYFFWSIPESKNIAIVGMIADGPSKVKEGLSGFLKKRGLEPLEFQEAPVPIYRLRWLEKNRGCEEGVFLIGDAAAHVKATTVGGVVAGLWGAKALARAILRGKNYEKELRDLRFELDIHLLVRNVLNRFRDDDYDELLRIVDGRIKRFLQQRTRDELRSFFFKMILREPHFLLLGMKSFMRFIFG